MKQSLFYFALCLSFLFFNTVVIYAGKSSVSVIQMQCEYLSDPEGLDETTPRFSWKLKAVDSEKYGQAQKAYRIIVSENEKEIEKGEYWDSGWIISDETRNIVYKGRDLESDKTYYWKVQVKDEKGKKSSWSETAYWSTGILKPEEWTAKWIGSDEVYDPGQPDCNVYDPWLRKTIELKTTPGRAMMYIASVGYHELYVNGEKVGDHVLAPAVSDHTTRARYIAYNIADKLKPGRNCIAIWLGTSWAIFPQYATADKPRTPIVIAQADIYAQNAELLTRVQTDHSWKMHRSPNRLLGKWEMFNMGGEIWDDNMQVTDWNLTEYDDFGWKNAIEYSPELILSAQNVEPNRILKEITPVAIEKRPDGSWRIDMGVNYAGWINIPLKADPGTRIDLYYSEREQDEMTFNNHNAFIMGKSGEGTFKNRFNYSSGRWITIKGMKEKPDLSGIKGWMIRTDFKPVTTFQSSDPLQNWIYDRIKWTFENLSIGGYIVDCPQRERMGYGGDAHATSETGMFNYQLAAFYTKWMQDWRDVQGWESMGGKRVGGGVLPHTAPTNNGGGGPSWGGICVVLPWLMYQHENDIRVLEANYDLITRWLGFLDSHTENDLLKRFGGTWDFLGDWLWPNATAEGMNNDKPETLCFNNSYRVYNLRIAAKIARVLGKYDDADKWEKQATVSAAAIHERFYDETDFSYADRSMANLAVALLAEVTPADMEEKVMQRLEEEIIDVRKGHIHVGITGGAMLFKLLREKGRDDLIYTMTSQTDYPGWGFMKENGATTIWEMWEKDLPGHSLLHSSYLYPGAWYIDGVSGIRRHPDHPGFRTFIIRPALWNDREIEWSKTSFDSPAGLISTEWKKEGGELKLNLLVPPNTKAVLYCPEEKRPDTDKYKKYIRRIEDRDGYILYEVLPGKYNL